MSPISVFQSVDESVLGELELMEKELDLDDILVYRSAAECKLQVWSSLYGVGDVLSVLLYSAYLFSLVRYTCCLMASMFT